MQPARTRSRFPPVESAGPDGLLLTGGQLTPDWLVDAYSHGIFPMPIQFNRRRIVAWISPDPRGILELDAVHVSRRLARRLARQEFEFSLDRSFAEVVQACAVPRRGDDDEDRWLTSAMLAAYQSLHRLGLAHSLEVWQAGQLVGGVFGVTIGGLFAGESMFHRVSDASKAALVILAEHLKQRGYVLFDVQWTNDHTRSLGAVDIPRRQYIARLENAIKLPVTFLPPP